MKKFTLEEIKEVINEAQLKAIEKFEERVDKASKKTETNVDSMTRMAMSMQNVMAIIDFERELVNELERR